MKALKKYIATRLDHLTKRLDEYVRFENTDTLHDVRVEIKKIKAFLLVTGRCVKGFNAHREFIPFREVFRTAGAIREPEVTSALAARYELDAKQLDNTYSSKHKEIFLDDAPVFIHRVRKSKKKLTKLAKEVTEKDCAKIMKELKSLIRIALSPTVTQTRLHKTRKTIKNVLYLDQVLRKLSAEEKNFFTSLEMLIGEFNDKQNLLDALDGRSAKATAGMRALANQDIQAIRKLVKEFYANVD